MLETTELVLVRLDVVMLTLADVTCKLIEELRELESGDTEELLDIGAALICRAPRTLLL